MSVSKSNFLKQLAQMQELSGNTIAVVFAVNPDIDISSREAFYQNIIGFFERYKQNLPEVSSIKDNEDEDELSKWHGKDLRIQSIRLKSLRGFPNSVKPFGIDFNNEKGEPQSLIILGGNGSGKSSVFNALEYCYCETIGEAQLRAYMEGKEEEVRFLNYLEHNDNGSSNIFCHIKTNSDEFNISKDKTNIPQAIRRKINPESHFVSDFDLYTKGQLDFESNSQRSFHNIVAQNLGLSELLEFEKHLKSFCLYRRQVESRNILSLRRNNESLNALNASNKKAIDEKTVALEGLKKQEELIPDDSNQKVLQQILIQIKQTTFKVPPDLIKISVPIEEFKNAYKLLLSKEVKNAGLRELEFLNTGLELINEHSDCPFCGNSKLNLEEVKSSVHEKILRLKEMNEAAKNVNNTHSSLIDLFDNFKNSISVLRSTVLRELSSVQGFTDFNGLFLLNTDLLLKLDNFLALDWLLQIFSLKENPNYLKGRNGFLFDLLNSNITESFESINVINDDIKTFEENRRKEIERLESLISSREVPGSLTGQIVVLEKEISELHEQNSNTLVNVQRNEAKIEELQNLIVRYEEVRAETSAYLKVLHNSLNEEVNRSFGPIKMVVEEVLERFFKLENRNIEILISKQPEEYDEESGEVLSEIITAQVKLSGEGAKLQPVGKYLNTFHYRLFTTMVGISIAIAARRNTGVNLPLVLDDVFYASDFDNRTSVELFLKEVFSAFKTFTPDMPLQLILFTHDQLIFESAIKIVKEIDGIDVGFAKLFPYTEAKDRDDYLNLIYRYPEYFPQTILNSLLNAYEQR